MNDMRRTILWSVFAFSLLMLWDGWLRHTGQPSMFAPAPAASVAEAASGAANPASGATDAGSVPTPSGTGANNAGVPVAAATAASGAVPGAAPAIPRQQLVLTTDVLRATVDTQGGNLVKVELLKYTDQDHPERQVLVLDPAHSYAAQSGLVGAAGTDLPNHTSAMAPVTAERTLADGQDALVLKLESAPVNGVKRVLTYSFPRGGYVVGVKQEVVNTSGTTVRPQVYVQLVRDGVVPHSSGFFGAPTSYVGPAFYTANSKFKKVEFKHIDDNSTEFDKTANNGWVSVVQHYFASAWLNTQDTSREFFARKLGPNLYAVGMLFNLGDVAGGQSKAFESQLYVGPQEEKKLEALAPGLELVKDYGLVTILAKPLFWLLYYIHSVLQNWGWSIVALVVLLKAAFYWLNAKAYRSMAKMKAINPRIQEMRERLKDKPQQMQQEMMKIYREEKVNPIGGCLPIMIQIPVFIALYWVLLSSVEIRNAPWIGWITDLSVKDPYFVLPLLMTLSTLLQTWLNPTPPDPLQAKMMWIMPLVFSVMFFFFPAGLVLYWLTNNILSIAQQWMINKQIEGATQKA